MKKIFSLLLIMVMLLSLIGVMTGCFDEPEDKTSSTASTSSEEDTSSTEEVSLPSAISGIEKIDSPALEDTVWTLSGGMIDGVEMEEEDVQTVLTNFGGSMLFGFSADNKVVLSNGETGLESIYTVTDGKIIYMDFNEYKYHGVFTDIAGDTVMIIANPDEPNSALYFLPVTEE